VEAVTRAGVAAVRELLAGGPDREGEEPPCG
jgi:hypothetical protein